MQEYEHNPEESKESLFAHEIKKIHEEFFEKVPEYDIKIWNPKNAIQFKKGSCMAELLYVCGGLIAKGLASKDDLFVRFSNDHATPINSMNRFYAHTYLQINLEDGKKFTHGRALEASFRTNRRDEKPLIEAIEKDQITVKGHTIYPLDKAIEQYAKVDNNSELISVNNLVDLYIGRISDDDYSEISLNEKF